MIVLDPTGIMPDSRPKMLLITPAANDPTGVMPAMTAELFIPSGVTLPGVVANPPPPTSTPAPLPLPRVEVGNPPKRTRATILVLRGACRFANSIEIFDGRNPKAASLVRRVRVVGKANWKAILRLEPGRNVFSVRAQGPGGTSVKETFAIVRQNS